MDIDRIKYRIVASQNYPPFFELADAREDRQEAARKVAASLKVPVEQVYQMWKEPSVKQLLKTFGYSVHAMASSVHHAGEFLKAGAMTAFEQLHKSKAGQALHKGTLKIDSVMDKHPILKKATGPAVAGLLVYMSLNGTYTGHIDADFDMSNAVDAAMNGNYSIADILTSPQGMFGLALFAGAIAGAPSVSYFSTPVNLGVGLAYTGAKKLKQAIEKRADGQSEDSSMSKLNSLLNRASAKFKKGSSSVSDWWDEMSPERQEKYLKEHPDSKYAN